MAIFATARIFHSIELGLSTIIKTVVVLWRSLVLLFF